MKKISDTKVELKVELDSDALKKARSSAIEKLAADLKVQGFRKGKAPLSLAEKQLDPNLISDTALDIAIRSNMPAVFTEAKCQPLAIEGVNVTKYVPDEIAEYTVTAQILPEVELGDYHNLAVEMDKITASEEDIQEILDNIINAYAEHKVVKRPAQEGDEVIIDFVGKKDGKEFPGGKAKDHHLVLGSKQFIPGFEEGIIGHASGDKFDLELTFPKDYPEKSLAGEKVIFETLVKQVNEVVKPQADNELAKKCGKFETIEDLKADIKKNLETQNEHRVLDRYRDDLVKALVKNSKVSAPEILIGDQLRFIHDDVVRNAASHGMNFEQYLERTGQSAEQWEKSARELAEERVKASLVLQILARQEEIAVEEAEVAAKIAELKDVYKNSKEALANLKKPEVAQDIRNRMMIEKAIDLLVQANQDSASPSSKSNAKAKPSSKTKKTSTKSSKPISESAKE